MNLCFPKTPKEDLGEAEAGIVTGDRCDCAKFASPFEECTKDSLLGWLTVWRSPFWAMTKKAAEFWWQSDQEKWYEVTWSSFHEYFPSSPSFKFQQDLPGSHLSSIFLNLILMHVPSCKSFAKRLDDAFAVWHGSMVIWYRSQVVTTNHCNVCSAALLQHCVE